MRRAAGATLLGTVAEFSVRRRWLFGGIVALGVWGCLELAALAAFRIVDGRAFGFARLRAERSARAGADTGGGNASGWRAASPLDHEVVHPYLGFVLDPEHPPPAPAWAPGRPSAVSSWGYNDLAPPLRRRARDRVIVGIVGGSVARAFARDAADQFAAELARSPHFAGRKIEFVRLAVEGYKQPQQLLTLSYLLSLGAEFDLLINLDGFNEVALYESGDGRKGVFPAYPHAWSTRAEKLPDPFTRTTQGEIAQLRDLRRRLARSFPSSGLEFSVLANLAWRVLDRQLAVRLARADERLRNHLPRGTSFVVTGPPSSHTDRGDLYEELAGIWRRSSLQLDRLCRANGIEYFHFLQPNQYVPDSKRLTAQERRQAYNALSIYRRGVRAGYPLLVRDGGRLLRRGVRFRDLTGIFRDLDDSVYRDRCCHLLPRGNEILAREMARFIDASLRGVGPGTREADGD